VFRAAQTKNSGLHAPANPAEKTIILTDGTPRALHALLEYPIMASVYKSLSKSERAAKPEAPANGVRKNKQRVLMLTSRGVTYR